VNWNYGMSPLPADPALGFPRPRSFVAAIAFFGWSFTELNAPLDHQRKPRQRSTWSDLGHAAVDEELDARDVAAFVGSKERDYFGDFVQGPVRPRGMLTTALSE
jgi:hypothetical protein